MTLFWHVRSPIAPTLLAVALLAAAVWYLRSSPHGESVASARKFIDAGCAAPYGLFIRHESGQWITVAGRFDRRYPDANGRLTHQRFVMSCANGLHLLVVNDVSIGMRVPFVRLARVVVRGQYEWDSQGGLLHFTHRSDSGGVGGWILVKSHIYQ